MSKTIRNPIVEACRKRYGNTTTVMKNKKDKRSKNEKHSWKRDQENNG